MGGSLDRVQIFSQTASILSFTAFSSRSSSLTQMFVESCVDFEVAIYQWSRFGDCHTGDSYLSIHKHNSSIQLIHW